MGGLLRRYWHPVAAVSELARTPSVAPAPSKEVRLMGEDLVLTRDADDGYTLCPVNGDGAPYLAASRGGLVWAYLGPAPPPLIPDFEIFHWPDGFVQIV